MVVERFTRDPRAHYVVRYVVEPTPGLSHARNRGLTSVLALGKEFVAYTDDDVSVDAHCAARGGEAAFMWRRIRSGA